MSLKMIDRAAISLSASLMLDLLARLEDKCVS
jgi:hypothetical protein